MSYRQSFNGESRRTSLKTLAVSGLAVLMGGGLLIFTLTGCVGVVDGGGPDVVVAGPPAVFVGGWWGHDRDAGRRGYESRGGWHGHR